MSGRLRRVAGSSVFWLVVGSVAPLFGGVAQATPTSGGPANQAAEVVAAIQIHGNNATSDEDVRAIAAVNVGDPFSDSLLLVVRRRLEASRRFESVDVLKRYASIADSSRIALVILVDDRAVRVQPAESGEGEAGARGVRITRRSALGSAMFLPWLEYEDGYGLTYGGVVAYPGIGGERGRLSFPLTWGGRKRAAAEYDRPFSGGAVGRVRVGAAREQRTNPAFDEDDDRTRVWARLESRVKWNLGVGVTGASERVSFREEEDRWTSVAVDVTLDTRTDPIFPRNAVLSKVSRTLLSGGARGRLQRTEAEVEGFIGLVGSPVLALRLDVDATNRPLPLSLQPLLGGWTSVRGFKAGSFHGDNRLLTSAELRIPLSSPLSVSRVGFSVFVDRGKVFDEGQPAREAPWRMGYGAGVWVSAAILQVGVSVGHADGGGSRLTAGVSLGR